MVLEVVGPVEEVGDQGVAHNLEEEGQEGGAPLEVDQIGHGREQGEGAGRRGLEDQRVEVEGPGQEVEVLVGLVGQVDLEGDVEDPASHLESAVEALQAQQDQGTDLQGLVVLEGTCLCHLVHPLGNLHHGVQHRGDRLYPPQTSGPTVCFFATASQTG